MRTVIGIDGGTESLRAGVFSLTGEPLAFASSPYDTAFPHPAWAEQNPEDWWQALGKAVRAAVNQAGIRPDQVSKAESARPCGAAAWRKLVKFNNLETHGYG